MYSIIRASVALQIPTEDFNRAFSGAIRSRAAQRLAAPDKIQRSSADAHRTLQESLRLEPYEIEQHRNSQHLIRASVALQIPTEDFNRACFWSHTK
jgi:hypothetical protein